MNKKSKRSISNILAPVAVYELDMGGPSPIKRPAGSTDADGWRDLRDVGRKLSLPSHRTETLPEYALRLRSVLARMDRRQRVGGAAVYMLLHIVNLECPPDALHGQSSSSATSGKDQP